MLGGVTLVRYANFVIYVALRRAKDCCRCSLLKTVIAWGLGLRIWVQGLSLGPRVWSFRA